MTQEQREQYLELQKIAQKEKKAEQAKARRVAKRWVQDRYGCSIDQLDKIVSIYRQKLAQHQKQKAAQPQAPTTQQRPAQDPADRPAPSQEQVTATQPIQYPAPQQRQKQQWQVTCRHTRHSAQDPERRQGVYGDVDSNTTPT